MEQATREQLLSDAPVGLYEIVKDGVPVGKEDRLYYPLLGKFVFAFWIEIARVRDGGEVPSGVDLTIRPDGKQVLFQFVLDESKPQLHSWARGAKENSLDASL